jgi:drug/metabolite transporter (DMT)-like permease
VLNWAGTAAQAYGLEQTSSTRAGFLLSTINVMVPVGAALQGQPVPAATWAACALALVGVVIISEIHVPMAGAYTRSHFRST